MQGILFGVFCWNQILRQSNFFLVHTLSEQMFKDGYENIISTDISEVCIANQKRAFPHLTWQVADIMHLKDFNDDSFDVVIEKATLDALLVGEKSPWHPSDGLCFISRKKEIAIVST